MWSTTTDKLFLLENVKGKVLSLTTTGSDIQTLISDLSDHPDGIQLDEASNPPKMYFTSMGVDSSENDGVIYSANLDGSDLKKIVKEGGTFTPKQLFLDVEKQILYWCDREGGRIQSCKTDGSDMTTLYDTAPGKSRPLKAITDVCVGIIVDVKRELLYWTQKGSSKAGEGRILRAKLRKDGKGFEEVEVLLAGLPEPIDLELDTEKEVLYCE